MDDVERRKKWINRVTSGGKNKLKIKIEKIK